MAEGCLHHHAQPTSRANANVGFLLGGFWGADHHQPFSSRQRGKNEYTSYQAKNLKAFANQHGYYDKWRECLACRLGQNIPPIFVKYHFGVPLVMEQSRPSQRAFPDACKSEASLTRGFSFFARLYKPSFLKTSPAPIRVARTL